MKEGFREALEKVVAAKDACQEYCQFTIGHDWRIEVYVHPDADKLHQAISAFTGLVGKLEKKQESYGTAFEFTGCNEFFDVRIKTPEQCTIVGYRIEKRAKKVIVESNEMEEIKTPVTDCDFRSGKVKAGEFEPLKETANV